MIDSIKKKACEIAVVLVCVAVFCIFVSMKEGYHMDELLSFELSNAEFNPWIVTTQPEGRLAKFVHNEIDGETFGETMGNVADTVKDVLRNRGNSKLLSYTADVYAEPVWITAEQFSHYITVEGRDAFNYLSVYFNVKDDNHPPLHFMLLHTVSSFFRRNISPWMGCVINLGAVIGILILLYKLSGLLAPALGLENGGRPLGLMAALFYGLSTGAVATVLLIRMYGLVTLWCVLYFYLIVKKWQDASFDRKNGKLIFVTMLGFWTQYFFLFYCLLLAAVAAVCLWKSRRRKELFCFVRSMLIAALAGLALFPFAVADVFSSGRGVEALGNLSQGLAGYGTRLSAFGSLLFQRSIGRYVLALVLALLVLWGAGMAKKAGEEKPRKADRPEKPQGDEGEKADKAERGAVLWMLLLPPAGYFLLAARMSPYLVDRYIMPLFPFASLVLMIGIFALLKGIYKRYGERRTKDLRVVVCGSLLLFQVWNLVCYDGSYLYKGYSEQEAVAADYREYPCICVYDGVGYYENLLEFTYYDKSLLLTLEELESRTDQESIRESGNVAVLVKSGVDEVKVLEVLIEDYGFMLEQEVELQQSVYGDRIFILGKS